MSKFKPNMYKKNVYDINYDKLEENKIKCLLFDLDNTILPVGEKKVSKKIIELIKKLKEKFTVLIVSNSKGKRPIVNAEILEIEYYKLSLKPLPFVFKKIMKKYNFKKEEICLIGDQLYTDILGGNFVGIYTVLVDPMGTKDLKVSKFNRLLEKRKF